MPQYNSYALITELLAADIVLVYKDSTGSNKTITAQNFANSVRDLMDKKLTVTVVSGSVTLDGDDEFIVANSGAVFTITLPDSADFPGKPFYISNKGAGTVTVAATGTDTIAGDASIELAQYKSGIFIPDGLGMYHWFGNPT